MKRFYLFVRCFALSVLGLVSFHGKAQITIDNTTYTVSQLVAGILIPVSSSTTVSNVTYQGVYNNSSRYQIGYFTTATTTLAQMGFSSGVVLSSGNTSDIPLTLGTDPRTTQMSTNFVSCTPGEVRKTSTCPTNINDLNVLSGGYNYFNASILEFDFVPVSNTVQFRYVFGSEEYEDNSGLINYECSDYNDKFGFLISGPGIAGGQGYTNNAKNIARLANGSEVSINSVNNGVVGSSGGAPAASKCQAANPNWIQNVSTAEYLGTIDGTEPNGNTIIMTAKQTGLTPGQTYHIKLIVTDVFDGAYDAVVYLEAGSFTTQTTANAGSNQTLCGSSTTLNASAPPTGNWTVISGTGSFSNSSNPNSGVTGLSPGANVFQWSDGTSAATVTVTVSSTPTVTAAGSGTITCSSSSVTLTGTSAGSTMVWNGGSLSNAPNPATVSAAGIYSVTATNAAGCSSTTTVSVTSNTTPPSVTANGGALTCLTTSVTLTGVSAGSTMVWNGGSLTNAANPATVSSAGNYTVTATGTNGCTNTSTVSVTSNTTPPTVTSSVSGNISCTVSSVTLTGTSPGNSMIWNGGSLVNASNPATVTAPGVYTVTATDAGNGCTAVSTVTVTSSGGLPNINIATPSSLTCVNSNVILAGSSTSTGVVYQWTSGPSTATYSVTNAGTYTLTVTDTASGCASVQTVTVFSNTTVPNLTAGSPLTLNCTNPSGTISASSTSSGITYSWTGPGIVSGGTTASPTVNLAGTYSVTVTDPANGCTSNATVAVALNAAPPNVTAGPASTISCNVSTVNINASSSTSGVSYSWTGPGILSGGNTSSPVVNLPGTYTVTVTNPANGCTSTATVSVAGNPGPTANAGTDITISPGSSVILTATGGGNYSWNTGETTSFITVTPTTTTDYCVVVLDSSGCSDTACVKVFIEADCGVLFIPNAFSPNGDGDNDGFNVKINPLCVEEMSLIIYDRWGEKMTELTDPKTEWDGTYKGELQNDGVYAWHLNIKLINSAEWTRKSGNVSILK